MCPASQHSNAFTNNIQLGDRKLTTDLQLQGNLREFETIFFFNCNSKAQQDT